MGEILRKSASWVYKLNTEKTAGVIRVIFCKLWNVKRINRPYEQFTLLQIGRLVIVAKDVATVHINHI